MKASSKHVISITLAAMLAIPSVALADELGTKGTIASLEVNMPSADAYLQHHGRIVVVSGNNKPSTSSAEYRWGGTACGSRTLSEAQVTMLQRALESGTPITPRFQDGQGSTKCLVGFTIAP